MEINWRAVAIGFIVSLAIGIVAGFTSPSEVGMVSAGSWLLSGLVGGAAAGYVAGHGMQSGLVHGILGTTIGGIVLVAVMGLFTTLLFGLVGLTAFLIAALMLGLYAIPGAVGGVVGAMLKGTETAEAGQPAGR